MMTRELKVCAGLVVLALFVFLGYFVDACLVRGRNFVEAFVLVHFPVPGFPDVRVTPMTLLQLTCFFFVAVLLEWEPVRLLVSLPIPRILAAGLALVSVYELLWNFGAWFTMSALEGHISEQFPKLPYTFLGIPTNFNVATKVSTLFTVGCLYALWRGSKVEKPPRTTAEYVAFLKTEIVKLTGRRRRGK